MVTQIEYIELKDIQDIFKDWTYIIKDSSINDCYKEALKHELWITAEVSVYDSKVAVVKLVEDPKPSDIAVQLSYARLTKPIVVQCNRQSLYNALSRYNVEDLTLKSLSMNAGVIIQPKVTNVVARNQWERLIIKGLEFNVDNISSSDKSFLYSKANFHGKTLSINKGRVSYSSGNNHKARINQLIESIPFGVAVPVPECLQTIDKQTLRNYVSQSKHNAFFRKGCIIKYEVIARNQQPGVCIIRNNKVLASLAGKKIKELTEQDKVLLNLRLSPYGIELEEVHGL